MIDRADGRAVDGAAGATGAGGVWIAGGAGFGFGAAWGVWASTLTDTQHSSAAARRTEPRWNLDRPLARSKWRSRILKLLWCGWGALSILQGKTGNATRPASGHGT